MINVCLKNIGQPQYCHLLRKVLDKIVTESVIDFLENHDILYNKQFRLKMGHSTTHTIIVLTEKKTSMAIFGHLIVYHISYYLIDCMNKEYVII